MTCPSCAHENRPGAKFCEECAGPLKRVCASCGSELRPSAKFCDECAAPVAGAESAARPAALAGARKIVTIVFADLVGSTALHERLDPESARRFMESYYDAMRGAVESHGGTVTQLLGDGVKAVFGIPRVAEDDAIRAVRAAALMQESFRALAEQQRGAVGKTGLRVAVNTGEVIANDETEIIGDPVNVAARLQEQGRDGDVVVGDSTARLVSSLVTLVPLGSFTLKGRAEAVSAFRVESLERPEGAATTAFVGRDAELTRITIAYETAVANPATGLAVLLGSPGLGKSRLIDEFERRLGDTAQVLTANCDAAGGATFAPLADALREFLRIDAHASGDAVLGAIEAAQPGDDADRARIAAGIAALLAGSPASPEETFFVVRRLLAAIAQSKPVVLVIDDLHWAESLLLDLVEHLVQWGSGVRLLVLVGARPELRDLRSSLVIPGGLVADVVTLGGLDAGAAMRLAANVIGAADLPAAVAAKVLATSEGNPLFVGELVRMLVHEGALKREGDRWTAGTALAALEIPPTIHALLAARIERLRPEDRTVLERAAVVGRHFSRSAVAELLPRDVTDLDARLESLRRSDLIERDTGWFLGEPVLRFHHVLIRDAAYRQLLKGTRAELHARFADWALAKAGDAVEHDETIGWHLEQAHQHLRELGPIDAKGRVLGERASRHLAAAGRRALDRDDLPLAASLLGRALERLDPADPARADLALDWCEALLAVGEVGPAAGAIGELGRFTGDSDRLRAWHTCFAAQHTVLTDPEGLNAAADRVAAAAQDLTALGDAAGEAKAHYVHALALSRLGKVGACEAALDRALAAARRGGDRRRANTVLAIAPLAALWGPSPVTRASGRCLDVVRVLRITQGAPAVEAVALSCQGVLEALRGRGDAARRMIASARKMVEELGITQRLLEADVSAGLVELLEGDAPAAERSLRGAYDGLRDLGLGIDAARAAALLARALLAQDRAEEAEALSHESEALAGDDLKAAIAWRGVRAEALAKRGEHAAAVEFASKAVELAAATDALLDHADARLALAAALRAAGRGLEADAEERRATELWEAKGATLLAERARGERGRVEPVAAPAAAPVLARPAVGRRVRPNATTAMLAGFDLAVAARDFDALAAAFHADHQEIDHPTGSTYGRDACIASMQRLFRSNQPYYEAEPIASLGEFLVLVRRRSGADGASSGRYEVGAYENEAFQLFEADEHGLCYRAEVFADDHLGDAITRLYERYADLLPEGPERARAAATARALETMLLTPADLDRLSTIFTADFESVDHRHLSTWSLRGGAAFLEHIRALHEVAADVVIGVDDVLALEPHALLARRMHAGIERVGGGSYERPFLLLLAAGADGRLARAEWFDADREADALARFDALTTEPATPRFVQRLVRPNATTAMMARFADAVAARDFDALAAFFRADHQEIDHPTGSTYGRDACIASMQRLFRSEDPYYESEPIASLGEFLVLGRRRYGASGASSRRYDVGAYRNEAFQLVEVDEHGRYCRAEVFAHDHLGDAIARLYERHAELLPDGPERERAAATAHSIAALLGQPDFDRWGALSAPAIELVDHRVLGLGSLHGAAALRDYFRAMFELESFTIRVDEILALEPHAFGIHATTIGTGRTSGGAFERPLVHIWVFGSDGLASRIEFFDLGREAESLARFDALVGNGAAPPESPFANAASRSIERNERCWAERDWEGALALLSPALRFDDRRRMMRLEIGYEDFVAQFRMLFDQPASRWHEQLLATRGERLVLTRTRFEAEVADGGGPLAFDDHLSLTEVDADGRLIATVTFDLEDEDAAYAELDARFAAGESVAHPLAAKWLAGYLRCFAARDWNGMRALFAPDLVGHNHRLVGWGTLHGPAALVSTLEAQIELAPDTQERVDHVRTGARGVLFEYAWHGTHEGGAFENLWLVLVELDGEGRARRADVWEAEQQGAALARFAELNATTPTPSRFANTASRALDRAMAAWSARDWDGFARVLAREFGQSDRRKMVQLELDREQSIAFARQLGEMASTRVESELLATRGDRLSLSRLRVEAADGAIGPSEIESLMLYEANHRGEVIAYVRFDPGDLDAAYTELDARFDAGEAAAHPRASTWTRAFRRGFASRDWDALAALGSPALVAENHRLVGWGTLRGPAAWVPSVQSLTELAPDARLRFEHQRTSERGVLFEGAWIGTRDGGAFEIPVIAVVELDALGKNERMDVYDPDQLDTARARFDEVRAKERRDPRAVLAKPNAATAARERLQAAFAAGADAGDWGPMRQSCAPDMTYEDRQRLSQISGDRELYLASLRERVAAGASPTASLVATAGDRVDVSRFLYSGGPPDGRFEIEFLSVFEVDASGVITAIVMFDPEDLRAAQREAWTRWAAIDPVAAPWVALLNELTDAWNAHDVARVRACWADDVVVEDHRLAGLGRIEGADAYVESFVALWDLAPDQRVEFLRSYAVDRHGAVFSLRRAGTLENGGAFENEYAWLGLATAGRITRLELFEIDALDAALARFEALRRDPLRIPPNAAARATAFDPQRLAEVEGEALIRALVTDDFVFDDRTRRSLVRGGVEEWLRSLAFLSTEIRGQIDFRLVATAGDRLALHLSTWQETPGESPFVIGHHALFEIDAAGKLRALVLFDADDRAAAQTELFERYVASGADGMPRGAVEFLRGLNEHDLVRARSGLCDDFVLDDHRRTGLGRLEGAGAYIASVAAAYELAPDLGVAALYTAATATHGHVLLVRAWGTNTEGGAFESIYVALVRYRDAQVAGCEFFEPEHLDEALARFEALRAESR